MYTFTSVTITWGLQYKRLYYSFRRESGPRASFTIRKRNLHRNKVLHLLIHEVAPLQISYKSAFWPYQVKHALGLPDCTVGGSQADSRQRYVCGQRVRRIILLLGRNVLKHLLSYSQYNIINNVTRDYLRETMNITKSQLIRRCVWLRNNYNTVSKKHALDTRLQFLTKCLRKAPRLLVCKAIVLA